MVYAAFYALVSELELHAGARGKKHAGMEVATKSANCRCKCGFYTLGFSRLPEPYNWMAHWNASTPPSFDAGRSIGRQQEEPLFLVMSHNHRSLREQCIQQLRMEP